MSSPSSDLPEIAKLCCGTAPVATPAPPSSCGGEGSAASSAATAATAAAPIHAAASCCGPAPVAAAPQLSSCCGPKPDPAVSAGGGCCGADDGATSRTDWLLWGSLAGVALAYGNHVLAPADTPPWLHTMGHGVYELINTMWWGVLAAAIFVGVIGRIPQQMIVSVLGKGGTVKGLWRATMAGVLLDLCSHGILMVGMQLYQRGASAGQVVAFLLASPWNSLSLTIILVALIGLPYTLLFIALSMVIGLSTGWLFDRLVARGTLPANPNRMDLPEDYHFWREVKTAWRGIRWSPTLVLAMLWEGIKGSRMVLRWLLFGVLLATAIRAFVDVADFQNWFGPTVIGLLATLLAATIIEVCSEGSTPIAADLVTRAHAPGNGFAFLMTGVSTDYTEVMVIKDTTRSWKLALFLPLLTVPQVFVVALILNGVL